MYYATWFRKLFLALFLILSVGCPAFGVGVVEHPSTAPSYRYLVVADGVPIGVPRNIVDAGAISASVTSGASGSSTSHSGMQLVGFDVYSDVTVCFSSLSPVLVGWINDMWDFKGTPKSLRIACISSDGAAVWDRTYDSARISGFTIQECVREIMPAPGGSTSRVTQPALFIVKFRYVKIVDNTGPFPTAAGSELGLVSLSDYMPSFSIDGIVPFTPCSHEPISIKIESMPLDPNNKSGVSIRAVVSNVVASVPFDQASGLLSWAKTWLPVNGIGGLGNRTQPTEKSGTITWRNDRGETTCTLSLKNVGVCGYNYLSDNETNPLAKVSLFCDEAKLTIDGASTTGSSASNTTPEKSRTLLGTPKPIQISDATGLGTPRKLGPFELVVKSVEYVSTPLKVAGNELTPTPEQKLFVVRYSLRNPASEQLKVDSATLGFRALDVSGATHENFTVGIGARMAGISGSTLNLEDTLTFTAVAIIPAEESIVKLRIAGPDQGSTEYTLAAK